MIINCHTHIFSIEDVPREFRDRFFLDRKCALHSFLRRQFCHLLPAQSRLKRWLELADLTIPEIADRLVEEMDEASVDLSLVLTMDMAFCEVYEGPVRDFEQQLAETRAAVDSINERTAKERLIPFVAADPRRAGVETLVRDALSEGGFGGVKIYPPMGFLPDHKALYPIYDYCQEKRLPVTAHCQNGGIPGLQDYYHFADPAHWKPVLEQFPDLVLNLAHFDRLGSRWRRTIEALIKHHAWVFTDISYALELLYAPWHFARTLHKLLEEPATRSRILYGTDWYMGGCFWTESSYQRKLRGKASGSDGTSFRLSSDEMHRLTDTNPRHFLAGSPDRF